MIKGKDGTAVTLKVTPFKVREDLNGFWSYTVYDAEGWIVTRSYNTAKEMALSQRASHIPVPK